MKSVVVQSRKSPMGHFHRWHKMPALTIGLALALGFSAVSVTADELRVPVAENARQGQQQDFPDKGMSMTAVESRFGAPARRTDAVGKPPISQWHYGEFVVYFENRHVIHTVAKRPGR